MTQGGTSEDAFMAITQSIISELVQQIKLPPTEIVKITTMAGWQFPNNLSMLEVKEQVEQALDEIRPFC